MVLVTASYRELNISVTHKLCYYRATEICPISSVVERFIDIEEAGSSILPSDTAVHKERQCLSIAVLCVASKLLCLRAAVSDGDMFYSLPRNKTVESGEEVLMSVAN